MSKEMEELARHGVYPDMDFDEFDAEIMRS
jgi:hypothetical protein